MTELLRYLTAYEVWVYIVLGAVGLIYLRKFVLGLQEWQAAMFGLEKNLAQRKLSGAVSILILLLLLAGAEFVVVSFVVPNEASIFALPTPTLDLLMTPTVTLSTNIAGLGSGTGTPSATEVIDSSASNCQPGKLDFTNPKAGDTLTTSQGLIEVHGVVTIPPNFGYYKYEYAPANSQTWNTIQGNDKPRCPNKSCQQATQDPKATEDATILGNWDLSQLTAGDYLLRLVATDNNGNALPACQIQVHITGPTPAPGS